MRQSQSCATVNKPPDDMVELCILLCLTTFKLVLCQRTTPTICKPWHKSNVRAKFSPKMQFISDAKDNETIEHPFKNTCVGMDLKICIFISDVFLSYNGDKSILPCGSVETAWSRTRWCHWLAAPAVACRDRWSHVGQWDYKERGASYDWWLVLGWWENCDISPQYGEPWNQKVWEPPLQREGAY